MAGNDDRLFLITGATGKTGTASVRLLAGSGQQRGTPALAGRAPA